MGAPVDLIKRLIAAGIADEDLQAIIDAFHVPVPSVTERNDVTPGALRQQRYRERHKASQSVTVTSPVTSTVMLEREDKKERKITAPRGTRLPDGWLPSADTFDWAVREYGILGDVLQNELGQFADYWQSVPGAKGTKLDWDKTFRNRIRDIQARGKTNGHKSNLQLSDAERYERAVEAFRSGKAL